MKTKNAVLLVVVAMLLVLAGLPNRSYAGVSVGVGINIPAYEFSEPPPLVVIPGTYAYFVPGIDLDMLFYNGYWYRPYEGRWYRSRAYSGPWSHIGHRHVPRALIGLPPDFRHSYRDHRHIPYGDFHKNWRRWAREKHWERDEHWREGRHDRRHGGHRDRHDDRRGGHDGHRGGHDDHRGGHR